MGSSFLVPCMYADTIVEARVSSVNLTVLFPGPVSLSVSPILQ